MIKFVSDSDKQVKQVGKNLSKLGKNHIFLKKFISLLNPLLMVCVILRRKFERGDIFNREITKKARTKLTFLLLLNKIIIIIIIITKKA